MNELTPLSTEELMDMFERVDDRQCTGRALAIYAELNRRSMSMQQRWKPAMGMKPQAGGLCFGCFLSRYGFFHWHPLKIFLGWTPKAKSCG